MTIGTYALYDMVFNLSSFDIQLVVDNNIKDFDPVESICFSSYLNMYCQTKDFMELLFSQVYGEGYLLEMPVKIQDRLFNNRNPIYHRENLLYYIKTIIVNKVDGKKAITGNLSGHNENTQLYGKTLLLINNKLNNLAIQSEYFLERDFIRSYPPRQIHSISTFYKHRVLRYHKIYFELIDQLGDSDKKKWEEIKKQFKDKVGVELVEYMDTVELLFIWFSASNELNLDIPKFNPKDTSTFYINEDNFKSHPSFINTLKALGKNLEELTYYYGIKKTPEIDNELYYHIPHLFDYPIFRPNEKEYVIMDLAFFLEQGCGGLAYKLLENYRIDDSDKSARNFWSAYGNLLELYFRFLMGSMFEGIVNLGDPIKQNEPDATLDITINNIKYCLIFEFTAKRFFSLPALYNTTSKEFKKNLNKKLFDKDNSNDSDVKFRQLNKFINNAKKTRTDDTVFIPILVTENSIGDYELLNRIDSILDKGIEENELDELKTYKPILLSLDDLEFFWSTVLTGKEAETLVNKIINWEYLGEKKGTYLFSFLNYAIEKARKINDNYLKMFETRNLGKRVN